MQHIVMNKGVIKLIESNEHYGFEADDLNYILMRKTYKRRKEKGTWVTTDEET